MSNAPDEFEQLSRLLKLKRYEQPPPRFFEEFSGQVLVGIESTKSSSRFVFEIPWLTRLVRMLETNPLVAGSFATSICALLLGGIVYSEYVDQSPAPAVATSDGMVSVASVIPQPDGHPAEIVASSTNAIFSSGMPGSPLAPMQLISYTPGGQ